MGNQKLYTGSLQTIILKLLETNDKMYGYEITQHVKALTNGELKITEAVAPHFIEWVLKTQMGCRYN